MHSTDVLDDGYLGSGVRFNRSVKKYGKSKHVREILEHCTSRTQASEREKVLITPELRADPNCLNCGPGGLGTIDRPATTEETSAKITKANLKRWATETQRRIAANVEEPFSMTREQILEELLLPSGLLNKNATRNLFHRDIPSRAREAQKARKWNYILQAIQNPAIGDNLVELINAYAHGINARPVCKQCSSPVSFFRFGRPYATHCSTRCAMAGNLNASKP
jgi:hypothetical protein